MKTRIEFKTQELFDGGWFALIVTACPARFERFQASNLWCVAKTHGATLAAPGCIFISGDPDGRPVVVSEDAMFQITEAFREFNAREGGGTPQWKPLE